MVTKRYPAIAVSFPLPVQAAIILANILREVTADNGVVDTTDRGR